MSNARVNLYYKNVTAEVIGEEHGVSAEQFAELADQVKDAIHAVNNARNDNETPYRDLPYNAKYSDSVKQVAEQFKGCENFVVLGIGGSALGNIALQTALNPYMYNVDAGQRNGNPRLFVLDNVDPSQFGSFVEWISGELENTVFNVVSKSGRTAETASQFLSIVKVLENKLGADALKKHVIATTDANQGTLRKIADNAGLVTLEVPDGVGGRFSVLSPVGLMSAAMCGIDIDELLAGARSMDQRVSTADFKKNPALVNAAINWHYYNRDKKISVMFPYAYALKDLADWYRQLWAESLGKAKDVNGNDVFVGATPVKALGTTDQHSQVQLYREGPNDKLYTFLQVKKFDNDVIIGPAPESAPELNYLAGASMAKLLNSEKIATEYAMLQDERPCMTVLFDKIDAHAIGEFIYLFEVTTSITGRLLGINTYDQPAVELGKEATFALMGCEGFEDMAAKIAPYAQIDEDFVA